jgi:GTPase SAR1 family protein
MFGVAIYRGINKFTAQNEILTLLSQGYFSPKQQSTIGAFFLTKKVTLASGAQCKMQLWDTG